MAEASMAAPVAEVESRSSQSTSQATPASPTRAAAGGLAALQGRHGNRGVQRLLAAGDLPIAPGAAAVRLGQRAAARVAAVQRKADGPAPDASIRAAARAGVASPTGPLPYAEALRRSFGRHDLSNIRAHVGPEATRSAHAMHALAFASGEHVVFAGAPSLHTVAHEAAHVIQQRGGLRLAGGVGRSDDRYERNADEVAAQVLAGRSAEHLLDLHAGRGGGVASWDAPVQRLALDRSSVGYEFMARAAAGGSVELFNQLVSLVLIPLSGADALVAGLAGWLAGWVTDCVASDWTAKLQALLGPAFAWLDWASRWLSTWQQLDDDIKAVIKFAVGQLLRLLDAIVSAVHFALSDGDDISNELFSLFEPMLAYEGNALLQALLEFNVSARSLADQLIKSPVRALAAVVKRALHAGLMACLEKVGLVSPAPAPAPSPSAAPSSPAASAPAPKKAARALDFGFVKATLGELAIAKTTDQEKGGLAADLGLELNLFGKHYPLTATETRGLRAVLQWDLGFHVDWRTDLTIVNKLDAGPFSLSRLKLKRLAIGDAGLEALTLSIDSLSLGTPLEITNLTGAWDRDRGLVLSASPVTLRLPDPFGLTIQSNATLELDDEGRFRRLALDEFQGGEDLTIAHAELGDAGLDIVDARYQLGGQLSDLTLRLDRLTLNRRNQVTAIAGGLTVNQFAVAPGVTAHGTATVGWKAGALSFTLADAGLAVEAGPVHASAALKQFTYTKGTEGSEYEGALESLSLRAGPLAFTVKDATFSDKNGLHIKTAEAMIGGDDVDSASTHLPTEDDAGKRSLAAAVTRLATPGPVELQPYILLTATDINFFDGKLSIFSFKAKVGATPVYKISLLGGHVHGIFDPASGTAALTGRFGFPPKSAFWPLKLGATLPIHPTPLSLFVELEASGGIQATIDGSLTKPKPKPNQPAAPGLELKASATLDANLSFSIKGGIKLGLELIAALRAYLEAYAKLVASAKAELSGAVEFSPRDMAIRQRRDAPIKFDYSVAAELLAGIQFKVDAILFMVYSKELYTHKFGEWSLGRYNAEGTVSEAEGKLKVDVRKPDPSVKDSTMGGAVEGGVQLPKDGMMDPVPADAAIVALRKQNQKIHDDALTYRLVHDLYENRKGLTPEQIAARVDDLKVCCEPAWKTGGQHFLDLHIAKITARKQARGASLVMSPAEWTDYSTTQDRWRRAADSLGSLTGDAADSQPRINPRKTIVAVDRALDDYHKAIGAQRLVKLEVLSNKLSDYAKDNRSRSPMVLKLLADTVREKDRLKALPAD